MLAKDLKSYQDVIDTFSIPVHSIPLPSPSLSSLSFSIWLQL